MRMDSLRSHVGKKPFRLTVTLEKTRWDRGRNMFREERHWRLELTRIEKQEYCTRTQSAQTKSGVATATATATAAITTTSAIPRAITLTFTPRLSPLPSCQFLYHSLRRPNTLLNRNPAQIPSLRSWGVALPLFAPPARAESTRITDCRSLCPLAPPSGHAKHISSAGWTQKGASQYCVRLAQRQVLGLLASFTTSFFFMINFGV